jgi:hypothetical protein
MLLKIDDHLTIAEVQERFSECFPFLKLEFFTRGHKLHEASDKKDQYLSSQHIGDIRKRHYNGVLEIKSWYTTGRVEQDLKDLFDLNVQILRHDTIGEWIQSCESDDLTLQQQSAFATS